MENIADGCKCPVYLAPENELNLLEEAEQAEQAWVSIVDAENILYEGSKNFFRMRFRRICSNPANTCAKQLLVTK